MQTIRSIISCRLAEGVPLSEQLSQIPLWGLVVLGVIAGVGVFGAMTFELSSVPVIGQLLCR